MRKFKLELLYHNTVDIWINFCEKNNVNWNNVNSYLKFIEFLKSLKLKMTQMNLCIKETGGLYQRGKKKAEFLDDLSKIKQKSVYIIKLDENTIKKIEEYIKKLKR